MTATNISNDLVLLEGRTIKDVYREDDLERGCLLVHIVFTDGTRLQITEQGQAGYFTLELSGRAECKTTN